MGTSASVPEVDSRVMSMKLQKSMGAAVMGYGPRPRSFPGPSLVGEAARSSGGGRFPGGAPTIFDNCSRQRGKLFGHGE